MYGRQDRRDIYENPTPDGSRGVRIFVAREEVVVARPRRD